MLQGSVLGPVLSVGFLSFADDTNICYESSDVLEIKKLLIKN